eukprot:TRINITY_DN83509_c0_g1_i1.p2 TRINITY_DN83509_c0_g1~~TRINITY_DN83509_c0_g1_i1.p2  ORF type:complete len:108 (-),score=12.17 TRINITY_DN83509_c0_g1_i1:218-541(-)
MMQTFKSKQCPALLHSRPAKFRAQPGVGRETTRNTGVQTARRTGQPQLGPSGADVSARLQELRRNGDATLAAMEARRRCPFEMYDQMPEWLIPPDPAPPAFLWRFSV